MDKLWAPWRSSYIYLRSHKKCIFCGHKRARNADKSAYIIMRSAHSLAMLNIYPYNNGHVMVAPYRHVKSIDLLKMAELDDMMRLVVRVKKIIDSRMKPHGYNIGMNVGKVGGAGYDGHMHIHVVPRWKGDTNFMPVLSDTKVVSDSLEHVYTLLR